jgi:hypothetical protein
VVLGNVTELTAASNSGAVDAAVFSATSDRRVKELVRPVELVRLLGALTDLA